MFLFIPPLFVSNYCLVAGPKINKADLPPRQSHNAYVIFYTKYLKGLSLENKPKSLQDIVKLSKEASAKWKNFSEAEKQVRFSRLPSSSFTKHFLLVVQRRGCSCP